MTVLPWHLSGNGLTFNFWLRVAVLPHYRLNARTFTVTWPTVIVLLSDRHTFSAGLSWLGVRCVELILDTLQTRLVL